MGLFQVFFNWIEFLRPGGPCSALRPSPESAVLTLPPSVQWRFLSKTFETSHPWASGRLGLSHFVKVATLFQGAQLFEEI